MSGADALELVRGVLVEGDGCDDDSPELDTLEGYALSYPAAAALAALLADGGVVRTDDGRVSLSRVRSMHDAPWHVTGAAVRDAGRGDWRAHDTLSGACSTFAELAGLEVEL